MKNTHLIALGLTTLAVALSPALAETYRWKDANGRTIYSDTPPPGSVKTQKSADESPATTGTAPGQKAAPSAPKSAAEQDMAFKKRQLEAKEKAEKEAKDSAAAAEKRENCERAKQAAATLESNRPVSTTNEKGERTVMDNAQRQQELERAQKIAEESCK